MRRILPALTLLALLPAPADAQVGRPGGTAAIAGARLGYDTEFDAVAAGAYLYVPVLRAPFVLQAAGDVTFGDVTDRQLAADVLWRPGAGLHVGGGVIFRNSYYTNLEPDASEEPFRETRTGYSLVLSLGQVPGARSRFVTGLEVRWMFVEDFRPQTVMVQVGIPLLRFGS